MRAVIFDAEMDAVVIAMRAERAGFDRIARRIGVDKSVVRRRVLALDLPTWPAGYCPQPRPRST